MDVMAVMSTHTYEHDIIFLNFSLISRRANSMVNVKILGVSMSDVGEDVNYSQCVSLTKLVQQNLSLVVLFHFGMGYARRWFFAISLHVNFLVSLMFMVTASMELSMYDNTV